MALKNKKSIFARTGDEAVPESNAAAADEAAAAETVEEPEQERESEPAPAERDMDNVSKIVALWQRDAAMLKLIVPEFDLDAAIRNATFKNSLMQGRTVFEAYAQTVRPESKSRDEILQNGQNGTRGTGEAVMNPAKLSSEEFKKYIERIRNS